MNSISLLDKAGLNHDHVVLIIDDQQILKTDMVHTIIALRPDDLTAAGWVRWRDVDAALKTLRPDA